LARQDSSQNRCDLPIIVLQVRKPAVLGMADIQRADSRSRKFAILALAGILFGGVVLSIQFESWIEDVRRMPVEAARESLTTVFSWSVGISILAISLAGCHFWWWGRRVRRALRFPPPGATVLRDTVILEGEAAASRGTVLQLFGATLVLCATGVAFISWWAVRMFGAVHG
jgi:protein-S-isoprenylcysteine O-methyltransferase Ste14